MKVRFDFVTNSSSSFFIIGTNDEMLIPKKIAHILGAEKEGTFLNEVGMLISKDLVSISQKISKKDLLSHVTYNKDLSDFVNQNNYKIYFYGYIDSSEEHRHLVLFDEIRYIDSQFLFYKGTY